MYAAGLSALGIGFVPLATAYLLPLTTVVLFLGVSVLRVGAGILGERWPVAVAMASALLILIGKFGAESSVLLSSGVVGFTVATAWNAWRTAQDARRGCCTTPQTLAVSFHRSQHGSTDGRDGEESRFLAPGCKACEEAIALVRKVACRSCDVQVIDVRQESFYARAKQYGITRFPAIVIDGKLSGVLHAVCRERNNAARTRARRGTRQVGVSTSGRIGGDARDRSWPRASFGGSFRPVRHFP